MEKLSKILENEHLSFSHWVRLQAEAYVAAKENSQPPQEKKRVYPLACEVCGGKATRWGVKDGAYRGFCDAHFDRSKFACYTAINQ